MGEKNKKTVHESTKEGVKNESVDSSIVELDQYIDERIVLNVGGIKYETYRSTLTAYPKTLLGTMFHPRNRAMLHPTNGNEYFIDRNGYIFHYIMEYYRTGNIVWRPSFELPIGNTASLKSSNSSTTTVSSTSSGSNNNNNTSSSTHTDLNNATVPTGAAMAALSLTTNGILPSTSNGINGSNNGISSKGVIINSAFTNNNNISTPPTSPTTPNNNKPTNSNNQNHVLLRHCCSRSNSKSTPPIFPPYVSLPELEQEFSYFAIPFTSPLPIAQEAGGALLDEFAYSIEDLLCTAIAKLIDRISITFFRDGSLLECILIKPQLCSSCSASGALNCPGCNRRNNYGGNGAKLIEFSLNGYCIVNHFYEDIKKYLEKVFPNMIFKLEFGNNYKSITMSMSGLFTRNAIQKYSKI
ncbi:5297_t:CDS:2, partial [Funneliformis caledonium]